MSRLYFFGNPFLCHDHLSFFPNLSFPFLHNTQPQHAEPYCTQRYAKETTRLLGVLDQQLAAHGRHWIIGDLFTIADIAGHIVIPKPDPISNPLNSLDNPLKTLSQSNLTFQLPLGYSRSTTTMAMPLRRCLTTWRHSLTSSNGTTVAWHVLPCSVLSMSALSSHKRGLVCGIYAHRSYLLNWSHETWRNDRRGIVSIPDRKYGSLADSSEVGSM